jgi:hypothetical protein
MCSQLGKDCGEYHCERLDLLPDETGYAFIERGKVDWRTPPPPWCPLRTVTL